MDVPHMFNRHMLTPHSRIVRGEGVYIYDEFGKKYLDASGGANAAIPIGHGVRAIIDIMTEQAKKVSFVPMHLFSNEPAERLTDEIAKITPKGLTTTWLVNSGSEATDNAVKIARQYQLEKRNYGKFKIITRWQSFFGNTLGALSVGGHTFRRSKYIPLLKDMPHIPPAYCYRCWFRREYPDCDIDCATFLEKVVRQEGPECVAGFIAEPIVGATTGATTPPKEYFPIIREICDKYDMLFIADEVQTGVGRTGKWFAMEHWNVSPDIMTTAKGLSGGYTPLGAVITKDIIAEEFIRNKSNIVGGHTFCANPLSSAVGVAILKYITENKLVEKCAETGDYMKKRLEELQKDHPIVGDVRGIGLMLGIELVKDKNTKEPFPPDAKVASAVTREAMQRGVIVYPGTGTADGIVGDHILMTPPYIIAREHVDELISVLDQSITTVETQRST
jgi:adenosylmethionine-8-amino-7-oxononanoate aminotransferase